MLTRSFTRGRLRPAVRIVMRSPGWWAVLAPAALAHAGAETGPQSGAPALSEGWSLLREWSFDPLIWGLSGLFLWVFIVGALRRAARGNPVHPGRIIAYVAGVVLVWAALVSPLDYMAGHLFWMHQVQHMILHLLGPLLILAAMPQGTIYAGMPRRLRRLTIGPAARSANLRWFGRQISRPWLATLLFVLALYVWQIPLLHNAALLNEALHYFMHATMLLTGILFFWVVFDQRDPPKAPGHGMRQVMLIASVIAEIVLGALTTMKTVLLYPAYDTVGRLFDTPPMADEVAGGFLIWSPACMMFLVAMLLVVNNWNRTEVRRMARQGSGQRSNSAALLNPETAEELWMVVRPRNRRLGLGLSAVVVTMFALSMGAALTVRFVF